MKVAIGYAFGNVFGGFTIEMLLLAGMFPIDLAASEMLAMLGAGYWPAALRSTAYCRPFAKSYDNDT